jgi:hypothetical protein
MIAGIEHLYDKLNFYQLDQTSNLEINQNNISIALSSIYEKMAKIYTEGNLSNVSAERPSVQERNREQEETVRRPLTAEHLHQPELVRDKKLFEQQPDGVYP